MNGLQYVLPPRARAYAKFYVALLFVIATSVSAGADAPTWLVTLTSTLGAVSVFLQSNDVPDDAEGA